jgi:Enoyl-CoA hydratase/isomerase
MGYQTLIVERGGAIATITLNRPDARNAIDLTMRQELVSAFDEVEADEAARVLVLTGAGGHFCAGGDVKSMRARRSTAVEGRARVELLNRMVVRLVNFPRPTVAMVDGYAVGAGTNLALCCDLVVASDRARFGELFNKIGLVPAWSGWREPRSSSSRARSSTPPRPRASVSSIAWCRPASWNARRATSRPGSRPVRPACSAWPSTWSTVPPLRTWRPRSTSKPTPRVSPWPRTTTRKVSPRSSRSVPRSSPAAEVGRPGLRRRRPNVEHLRRR